MIEYASTIEDFDELVDPWTLARHCLGPEPSRYVLRAIWGEEKSRFVKIESICFLSTEMIKFFFFWAKMTTKFNQGMYARIKAKKNELLFSIGQRKVQVVQKETI